LRRAIAALAGIIPAVDKPRVEDNNQADTIAGLIRFNEPRVRPDYPWIPSWTFWPPSFLSVSRQVSFYLPFGFCVLST
jgi:hypothetical protein